MIRKASIMYVKKEAYKEYKKRHDDIWPEMVSELKKHGAHNYSIFLEEKTGQLFAYLEIESEEKWAQMAQTEACQKWWKSMDPLMETHEDYSPVSIDLQEVFYLA
ncbi:L-rhamnose mutarotase [Pullulanibacillus pueri]|uniref:L-rhamnose mutarotase n=1 Tax=Pullulanibacillus pueri TaxID=1437324 RepID=A0A8J2ZTT6_9BACL|nr:L-rhamnose mutarotase [Pullulanibacillus pueri]MBM7681161.1 L-rhamnose mutarotase [Pullulanibacillus pueri]GGH77285.1 L-rhamnose mutarotase [Pullulanibacillus pueri]